ncbi:MAG: nitronate monooxygenase [Aquabacterium sp.]|uniref:NAD(P)H-dependent flavin oxidoreductase n=1 Tax=Aquabacterium sp. TaxID=1872578 RepID=UPI00121EBA7E|nr:nitronate monooxygenase [Aquabacterium sp.]TAK94274.1 MAG: nitronate monooxygenase [Aquabacterium sp.]
MRTDTPFTRRLGLPLPIVQGPFGGGLSSVSLVAAVNGAGGLGSFGAHHLHADQIVQITRELRAATNRPFALNLWIPLHDEPEHPKVSDAQWIRAVNRLQPFFDELGLDLPQRPDAKAVWPDYAQQIEALLDARPAVFSFVFGIPAPDVLSRCRQRGIVTVGAATTPHEARLLEEAGVDMVVATGSDAGGHRVSFTDEPENLLTGTFSLIPQVRDAVRIPVIAAGGIADARGVTAAMALGADAVQIGTAFLACEESNAGRPHQAALRSVSQTPSTLTKGFSGRLSRGLRNRLTIELEQAQGDILPYPWQNWLTGILKRAAIAQNRADLMSLWAGQAAGLVRHQHAAALMQSLSSAFER